MRINPNYKVSYLAGENVVFVPGVAESDSSKLMVLNETSVWLWNSLKDRDFQLQDIVDLLLSEFDVDQKTASADAHEWVETLRKYNCFV